MINCAKDKSLDQSAGLPDVSEVVASLLQKAKVGVVQSEQIDGMTQDIPIWKDAMVSIQPMPESLVVSKEGDRSWRWFTVHSLPDLILETKDIFVLFGTSYQVKDKKDWSQYGYVVYHVIEHYKQYTV